MRQPDCIRCLLLALLLVGTRAGAAGSTITIKGYVKDNACTVSTTSKDFTVDLMSNSARQLNTPGGATPPVPFSIVLSPCGSAVKAVRIGFSGVADSDNPMLLGIDSHPQAASGVAIQILDHHRQPVRLNSAPAQLAWVALTPRPANTLAFYARLVATRIPVAAGLVSATATFTLEFQ
ncbi:MULTISPECIES: type 1 fimbrial adaptor subunit FimF [Dickeya]|uniref:Type 1 fimbrae adaptor subunit FimF n=1 Tax=Dickeya aquatica TaxID=1401087 RepID=A0A375A7J5_9GAMM|nr:MULTISPECIES: fimbrial protein [Dickeya]SLM61977.1 type 1 fimbrae adaptor subunit FimF [Dickeya aquatica]